MTGSPFPVEPGPIDPLAAAAAPDALPAESLPTELVPTQSLTAESVPAESVLAESVPAALGGLVLDTDLGSDVDDLLALGVLLGSSDLRLAAITTVYGNTPLRARLTRYALHLAGRSVPVVPGAPLPRSGAEVWQAGWEGELVPEVHRIDDGERPNGAAAADLLAEADTVLAVGPLTNLAAALERAPRCRIVHLMGGRFDPGSRSEHNVTSDVTAAAAVFDSGLPLVVIGLEQTTRVRLGPAELARVEHGRFGSYLAAEVRAYWRHTGATSNVPHDPLAALTLSDPELFERTAGRITVDEHGTTRFRADSGGPHQLITDLDLNRALSTLVQRLVAAADLAG